MLQPLDRDSDEPLYLQIYERFRAQIQAGDLAPGSRLPAERELAASVGVNRTTVTTAYHELAADGLVEGFVGRGTVVSRRRGAQFPGESDLLHQPLPWNELFSPLNEQARDPLISEIVALCSRADMISLGGGLPAPELYPVERFAQATETVLRRHGRTLLQYSATEGCAGFRRTLADLASGRGIETGPDNILVSAGSQQGLELLARALISPGDLVVVEVPAYLGALNLFRAAGARLLGVPVDRDGMRTDVLERIVSRYRPQLIYTLPSFQNPSGVVMSAERRAELLDLARRHQVPILEEDPYGELYFDAPPPRPIKAGDTAGHVIYVTTFSKLLFPGIRIGWLVAPRPVIDRLVLIKEFSDLNTNTLAQWALDEFIGQGWLEEHLPAVRPAYRSRCRAMQAALGRYVPRGLRWNRPEGGLYLWCHLDGDLRTRDLLTEAVRQRVAFVPGELFHADGGGQNALRLNYCHQDEATIGEGVRRLGKALEPLLESDRAHQLGELQRVRPIV
jgi:2-aminoadipate transaminase